MELQTIRTRNIAPSDVAVLSVSTIHSGVRVNITPDALPLLAEPSERLTTK